MMDLLLQEFSEKAGFIGYSSLALNLAVGLKLSWSLQVIMFKEKSECILFCLP